MVYTVFGLALMMLFLANIGSFMARTLKTVYSRLACRWCRVRRRWTELPEGADYEPDKIKTDIVGPEVRASKVNKNYQLLFFRITCPQMTLPSLSLLL